MIALIKKDFRNNLTPIVASVLALVAPYFIATGIWTMTNDSHRGPWSDWMVASAESSLWITAILAATYGGVAFAHERHERSANFLAMMPVTRDQIILSKTLVSLGCIGSMWLINGIAVYNPYHHYDSLAFLMPVFVGILTFGVAWMCSTLIESAAIAAAIGIGFAAVSTFSIALILSKVFNIEHDATVVAACTIFSGVVGSIAFIVGSSYYRRRIEP